MRHARLAALTVALILPLASPAAEDVPAHAPEDDVAADAAPPAGTANGVLRNLQVPPPGTPEDVALWNRANHTDLKLMAARGEATRLQATASTSGYAQRLAAAVARGDLAAPRAAALRTKLEEEWTELGRLLSARWRIDPTRVCRYPFLMFDNLMELADGPTKAPRLAEARGRLLECTTTAEGILKQLAGANAELRSALAAIDGAAGPASPPAEQAAPAPAAAEARR